MYPDLSYLFHDLFGTPVDNWASIFKTYGLFLVMAILSAALFLYLELKRKAKEGVFTPELVQPKAQKDATILDVISNAILGFLLGFKVLYIAAHFQEFQLDPSGVVFSNKGNWLAGIAGALLFTAGPLLNKFRKKESKPEPKAEVKELYPHHRIGDLTVIAAVSGVIGAKFFDIIEHLPDFFRDPWGMLFSGSGLAVYGGYIFGFLAISYYLRRKNIKVIHVLDAIAPAMMVAYAVGRLGCHFSGDGDWGIVNELAQPGWWIFPDWLWSFHYPNNVINENTLLEICDPGKYQELLQNRNLDTVSRCVEACGIRYCHQLSPAVFPTALYETITSLIFGGVLWGLRKRLHIPGMLFFVYLILNGTERFWIEKIRVNQKYNFAGLEVTQAEIIATTIFIIGVVGCVIVWQRHQRSKKTPQELS